MNDPKFVLFLLVVAIPAFITGFVVGWFVPAKWWPLYVFVGGCVIMPLVLVMTYALWIGEAKGEYLGMWLSCAGPGVAIFSVIPAMLGGYSAQWFRKRKESDNEQP